MSNRDIMEIKGVLRSRDDSNLKTVRHEERAFLLTFVP